MVDITIEQAESFLRKFRKPGDSKSDVQLARSLFNREILGVIFSVGPLIFAWFPFVRVLVQDVMNRQWLGTTIGSAYVVLLLPRLAFSLNRARHTSDILQLFESQGPQQIIDLKPDRDPANL